MGPPSYVRFVIDQNVVVRRMTVNGHKYFAFATVFVLGGWGGVGVKYNISEVSCASFIF
jgi:hypothetical protein